MQRHSQKRDSILKCLKETKSHPNAEWVYNQLKPQYPNLSLATVYRNLNQLKEEGYICSVGNFSNQERYDANIFPHTHAVCAICGCIIDIDEVNVPELMCNEAEKITGFKISSASLKFTGLCPECNKELKKIQ